MVSRRLLTSVTRRWFQGLVLVLVFVNLYFAGIFSYRSQNTADTGDTVVRSGRGAHYDNGKDRQGVKTILLWRPFYKDWNYGMNIHADTAFDECPANCRISRNRSDLATSDAVIFPMSDGTWDPNEEYLVRNRKANQRFIFFLLEMAVRAKYFRDLKPFNGFFNWTMSYRRDSDVYFPYGWTERVDLSEKTKLELVTTDFSKNKTHLVCWFVSHCHTGSKREWYAKHLQQHVNVSVFGGCGVKVPPGATVNCKFYLAFENMVCKDYVTEKVFANAYATDTVPIVYGGGDYKNILPKDSYLDIGDFNSPKALADYIKLLDKNDAMYNKYFAYKTEFSTRPWVSRGGVKGTSVYAFCNLCKGLHADQQAEKKYDRIDEWWDYKNRCPQWRPWPNLYPYFNEKLLPK